MSAGGHGQIQSNPELSPISTPLNTPKTAPPCFTSLFLSCIISKLNFIDIVIIFINGVFYETGSGGTVHVGKSTLFNALTNNKALAANYPFCTIEPNVGVVPVKDERVDALAKMYDSKKITYSTVEFVDIAGLVKGASKGEGLGNKFLSHIREVDAIVHVVRCFKDNNITHVSGDVNPVSDIETINLELIFADIETLNRRISKTKTALKSGDKKYLKELDILEKLLAFGRGKARSNNGT